MGIETSCDETAVALLRVTDGKQVRVEQNLVTSQIPIHRLYGGVVPEVAARSHVPEAVSLLTHVLERRGKARRAPTWDFDAIAVTRGPGLATALSVGLETAKALAFLSGKPIVGVNHLEGHLASAWLDPKNRRRWTFPLLALTVSGGHTELVLMKNFCSYKIIGQTRDDAAGEAFDKSAKLMGLPYPGGPEIARLAEKGDSKAIVFPRPMLHDGTFDFSFSGLKTAVRQSWEQGSHNTQHATYKEDFAASLQQAIVDVLIAKTLAAAKQFKVKGVLLVGGVSANKLLRATLEESVKRELQGVAFLPSDRTYITDNAAMITAAGYWRLNKKEKHDWKKLEVDPDWELV